MIETRRAVLTFGISPALAFAICLGNSVAVESGPDDSPAVAMKAAKPPANKSIDVTANKGSAPVACEGKKYTFANVAAYREKGSSSNRQSTSSTFKFPFAP